MTEINLTQTEADALIAMQKLRADDNQYSFPDLGGGFTAPLISSDKREKFLLDVSRGRIDLAKVKYQNRGRNIVVLVRLDMAGPSHRNPDDQEIPCPHLHIYREGYGAKWAIPLPTGVFTDLNDLSKTLDEFMKHCNITDPPDIIRGLFT